MTGYSNPMIGKKKPGDFKDEVIIETYRTLLEKDYPKNRVRALTLHTVMRYADQGRQFIMPL